MVFVSRLIAALAYAGAAFLFGLSLGERGELGFVQHIFVAVIPIATIILIWRSRGARAEVAFTGLVMLGGVLLGQRAYREAFAECPAKVDRVQTALAKFRAEHDDYPARLEDLGIDLPCDCRLRKTILHYLSNDRAYKLWISDDRATLNFTASGRSSSRSSPPPAPTR